MNNALRANLERQLRLDEGIRYLPYQDTLGLWTVGIGHKVDDTWRGRLISYTEVQGLFNFDLVHLERGILGMLPWVNDLDEARQGVLYNMGFNLGVEGLLGFRRTLNYAQARNYEAAALEMAHSQWAVQVGPRANRLELQMRDGIWQFAQ